MILNQETKNYFEENNYVVIKNFLNIEVSTLAYQYCINKVTSIDFKKSNNIEKYEKEWDGNFNDTQSPNDYSCYGDVLMESILSLSTASIENFIGKNLIPTYSYWRFYQKNSELKRHIDRPSCEFSATLCLGYNIKNVDKNVYPNYCWPIFVKNNKNLQEIPIPLEPGDLMIYKGCEIEHWREKFLGLNQAQVFLHYNEKDGKHNIKYDGRPCLSIPKQYQI